MKHIVLAALVATAGVGAASAQGYADLSNSTRLQVLQLVPSADLSNLNATQVLRLENLFDSSEELKAGSNPAGKVQTILRAQ